MLSALPVINWPYSYVQLSANQDNFCPLTNLSIYTFVWVVLDLPSTSLGPDDPKEQVAEDCSQRNTP